MDRFGYRDALHAVYASSVYYTTVKGYKNAVQSIGYAAAYPAMARIPPESATVYSNQ